MEILMVFILIAAFISGLNYFLLKERCPNCKSRKTNEIKRCRDSWFGDDTVIYYCKKCKKEFSIKEPQRDNSAGY